MGCITTFGRIIVVVLNLVFLLVSLAFIVTGVILKFFANKILHYIGDVDAIDANVRTTLHIPDVDDVTELPFVADVGVALLVFGCVLFVITFCGCCGACCEFRPLLIVFIILMSVLVIVQATVGGLFLAKNSVLHSTIKEKVGDKVKDDYDETGNDVFSFSINMLNYLLKCCGINGRSDFQGGVPALSCCKREVITADQSKCLARQSPYTDFYQQGCYDKLKDKVLDQLTVAAVVLALVLLLQVVEIVIAIFVVREASTIGPV